MWSPLVEIYKGADGFVGFTLHGGRWLESGPTGESLSWSAIRRWQKAHPRRAS